MRFEIHRKNNKLTIICDEVKEEKGFEFNLKVGKDSKTQECIYSKIIVRVHKGFSTSLLRTDGNWAVFLGTINSPLFEKSEMVARTSLRILKMAILEYFRVMGLTFKLKHYRRNGLKTWSVGLDFKPWVPKSDSRTRS